ncbi:hypothetical protein [Aliivibrio sifiae]|uniref:hypothetical protein n=1 Tax=Aliivibrio sifiae TaxID=566293 RepID=UPI003D0AC2EB
MNKFLITFLLLQSFYSEASQLVVFPVSTEIDKSAFIPYVITEMSFSPSSLTLLTNKENTSFENAHTSLFINTDIPTSDSSVKFQLVIVENEAQCYDIYKDPIETSRTFSHLFIDDIELFIGEFIPIEFNESENGSKFFRQQMTLSFEDFPDKAASCSGKFDLYSELSL